MSALSTVLLHSKHRLGTAISEKPRDACGVAVNLAPIDILGTHYKKRTSVSV